MRRLARPLITLCSAVLLLLCVALCVLWVRRFETPDRFISTAELGAADCLGKATFDPGQLGDMVRRHISLAKSPRPRGKV
jgi:hypothetical protein